MDSCRLLSLLDYGVQRNTPRPLGSVDKTNVYRDSGEALFSTKQSRAEFSGLLVRGKRTKGFLCCLRHSQPTTVEYSPAESESETSKLRDKLCADSGLILPRCYGLLSVLDQTNYARIYLRRV